MSNLDKFLLRTVNATLVFHADAETQIEVMDLCHQDEDMYALKFSLDNSNSFRSIHVKNKTKAKTFAKETFTEKIPSLQRFENLNSAKKQFHMILEKFKDKNYASNDSLTDQICLNKKLGIERRSSIRRIVVFQNKDDNFTSTTLTNIKIILSEILIPLADENNDLESYKLCTKLAENIRG